MAHNFGTQSKSVRRRIAGNFNAVCNQNSPYRATQILIDGLKPKRNKSKKARLNNTTELVSTAVTTASPQTTETLHSHTHEQQEWRCTSASPCLNHAQTCSRRCLSLPQKDNLRSSRSMGHDGFASEVLGLGALVHKLLSVLLLHPIRQEHLEFEILWSIHLALQSLARCFTSHDASGRGLCLDGTASIKHKIGSVQRSHGQYAF